MISCKHGILTTTFYLITNNNQHNETMFSSTSGMGQER